jgi:chromosome partitioning protein
MIIAISNQKGGVAKTTTAVSLGAAIVQRGHEVLCVDLDPQANLTLALGVKPASLRRTVADVFMGNNTPISVSRETALPGLDLMPANQDLQLVEKFLHVRQNHANTLRDALAHAPSYEYVLLDCPPALGNITLNALTAADILLVPTQCEYFSAHGLGQIVETVRYVREHTNPRLTYRVLVTMFDRRNRVHHTLYAKISGGIKDIERTFDVCPHIRDWGVIRVRDPDQGGQMENHAYSAHRLGHAFAVANIARNDFDLVLTGGCIQPSRGIV